MAKKRGRLVGWVGGFVVIAVAAITAAGWRIYSGRTWDQKSRITVVRLGQTMVVESIDPGGVAGIRMKMDPRVLIDSVGGRGKWLAGSIGNAGDTTWVADSVANYFGMAYDGVVGRMGVWDRWMYAKIAKHASWREVDLVGAGLIEKEVQPDKVEVFAKGQRLEEFVKENFFDSQIMAEGVSVGVINSTRTQGMGSHAARFLESRGVRVAFVKSQDDQIEKCEVAGRSELKMTKTFDFIMKWFKCDFVQRGDIASELLLVVGGEYRKWWLGE